MNTRKTYFDKPKCIYITIIWFNLIIKGIFELNVQQINENAANILYIYCSYVNIRLYIISLNISNKAISWL